MKHHTTATEALAEYDSADLADRYPNTARILVALRLALDLETCRSLLQGEPVDPARLDRHQLKQAREHALVRLDFHAIDHLTGTAA